MTWGVYVAVVNFIYGLGGNIKGVMDWRAIDE